jgi:hypothetical protein
VADANGAGQGGHHVWGCEVITHETHPPLLIKASFKVVCYDAACFLAAVLKGV